jgi:hypothetical protein
MVILSMLLMLIPLRTASCSRVSQPGGKGRRGVFDVDVCFT